jgi:hypothetical protein
MEKISKLAKILIKLLEKNLYLGLKVSLQHIVGGVATRKSSEDFGVGTCTAS